VAAAAATAVLHLVPRSPARASAKAPGAAPSAGGRPSLSHSPSAAPDSAKHHRGGSPAGHAQPGGEGGDGGGSSTAGAGGGGGAGFAQGQGLLAGGLAAEGELCYGMLLPLLLDRLERLLDKGLEGNLVLTGLLR
jgi:hypothetical protein